MGNYKVIFIINPASGKGRGGKYYPLLKDYLDSRKDIDWEIYQTKAKNHAKELSREHSGKAAKLVIAGGDGTINEAINGLNFDLPMPAIGIIPIGSGNDYAKTIQISRSFKDNIDLVLNSEKRKLFDTAVLSYKEYGSDLTIDRVFVNSLGIGFDALVSDIMQHRNTFRGISLYIASVIEALFKYESIDYKASFDSGRFEGKNKLLVAIGIGKTSGGGFKLNPDADAADGLLDACIIDNLPKLKVIKELPKAITGSHIKLKEVSTFRFSNSEILLEKPAYLHADGEVITTKAQSLNVKITGKKLSVIIK